MFLIGILCIISQCVWFESVESIPIQLTTCNCGKANGITTIEELNNNLLSGRNSYSNNIVGGNLQLNPTFTSNNAGLIPGATFTFVPNVNNKVCNSQFAGDISEGLQSNAFNLSPISGTALSIAPNLSNTGANTVQGMPVISEITPSLHFGDMSMTGDLPVGGRIKVCGCFPVYGTVEVNGSLPSSGTAVVDPSFLSAN